MQWTKIHLPFSKPQLSRGIFFPGTHMAAGCGIFFRNSNRDRDEQYQDRFGRCDGQLLGHPVGRRGPSPFRGLVCFSSMRLRTSP